MSRWMPSQIHVRIFLIQSVIFLAVTVPFSFYLSAQFQKYTYNQISRNIQNKVAQTVDNSTFMLDRLKSFSLNMYGNQDIHRWLTAVERDFMTENGMMLTVNQLLVNEPFVHAAFLINTRTESVYDSRKGIVGFANFPDRRFLDTVLHNRPMYLNFVDYRIGDNKFLALMIPSNPSRSSYYGYLVILLDAQLFQKFILGSDRKNGIEVVILNDAGEVVLGSADAALNEAISVRYRAAAGTFSGLTLGGVDWTAGYGRMDGQNWNIYYLERVDLLRHEIASFQNRVISVSLSLVVILLGVFFWNLRRSYKPVRKLAEHINSKLNAEESFPVPALGEIQMIERGVNRLFESVDQLNTSIRDQKQLLKEEYFRQWLLQGKLGGSLLENIENLSNITTCAHLYLAVCRIDSYRAFLEKYNFASRKSLKHSMTMMANEFITRQGWSCASVDFGSDHLVFLIGSSAEAGGQIPTVLKEIQFSIEDYLQVRVTLATSGSKQVDSEMRLVYDHIYELTMLKFISGNDRIYVEKDFEEYVRLLKPAPNEDRMDELLKAVRLGQIGEATDLLNVLFGSMKHLTYTDCRYRLILIIYSFMKEFSHLAPLQSFDGIANQLDRFGTLAEAHEWLENELVKVIALLNRRNGSQRKEEFVVEIVEYIQINIHNPLLSVEDISSHISLSVSYVRSIFKDMLHTTIADYILKERIERVKDLLVNQNWSIADIAERSGFQTKSNFYTVFKKITGFTPNDYRKTHQKAKA